MRVKIQFTPAAGEIEVPVNYNYQVQSFIYNTISDELSDFLHQKGYSDGKRTFKMFTFSRLQGDCGYTPDNKTLTFSDDVSLWIASPESEFLESYASELLKEDDLHIAGNRLHINTIEIAVTPAFSDDMIVKMISPVTIYSTLKKEDGKKKTYYYHPSEPEFSKLAAKNLNKKYRAYYETDTPGNSLEIEPERISSDSQKIIYYKDFIIKGWLGIFRLKGSKELIKLAWDTGIGSKNPQGFGMFEIVGE